MKRFSTIVFTTIIVLSVSIPGNTSQNDKALWQAIRTNGHAVLIRHALAPGIGDPENFDLKDCTKQRILSEEGRQQAADIGRRFREHGIKNAAVYSSQWCRCLDTAKRLDLGSVTPLTALNSFFQKFERKQKQTNVLKKWLSQQQLDRPMVLVTHQVNINALTQIVTDSGDMVVVRVSDNGEIIVLGKIDSR